MNIERPTSNVQDDAGARQPCPLGHPPSSVNAPGDADKFSALRPKVLTHICEPL